MRAVLLTALVIVVATAPAALASERCSGVAADRFEPLAAAPGVPGGWAPMLALDDSRLPAIPRLVAAGPGGVCEVTRDPARFAAIAGITDPAERAALAVGSAFPDQLGVPEVRSLAIEGGLARVGTWSAKDGVVADWVVDLATLRADFVVRAVAQGGYAEGFEGWHVWPGFASETLRAMEAGTLATKVKLQPLPNGAQFRLTYFTQFYASEAQADQYANDYAAAALAIWNIENGQWGFTSGDADNTYDITMDGCSCIYGGFNVNIHVHAKLESLYTLFNPPLAYPTKQHFFRVVIGHEWHHHLQYTINQWAIGNVLTEGGARFSETVFEPEGAHLPTTITYLRNANGFSDIMLNPNVSPTSRTYNFGLFWGFLWSTNSGVDMLKKVYQEADNGGQLYDVVNRALAAVPGDHDTFDAAHKDFALAMYKKSFVWAKADGSEPRDWGLYLPPAKREAIASPGGVGRAEANVVARGIVLLSAPTDETFLGEVASDSALNPRWVAAKPSGVTAQPAAGAVVVEGPLSDPVLLLARTAPVPNDPGARVVGAGKAQVAVQLVGEAVPG